MACQGCVGRGIGQRCSMCGGTVPVALRRTRESSSEIRADCRDCTEGRIHTH
jgi:hypothetical protein